MLPKKRKNHSVLIIPWGIEMENWLKELIIHTSVAGNLIKPMLSASKPLKIQNVISFLIFSTGVGKKH